MNELYRLGSNKVLDQINNFMCYWPCDHSGGDYWRCLHGSFRPPQEKWQQARCWDRQHVPEHPQLCGNLPHAAHARCSRQDTYRNPLRWGHDDGEEGRSKGTNTCRQHSQQEFGMMHLHCGMHAGVVDRNTGLSSRVLCLYWCRTSTNSIVTWQ